ncbi:MAG: LysR family transcriptional regulator [Deltaproteobacteria bacterium]|nr:LysR family transcriptional regulator [Deltaproteobacteria bacterium]
MKTPPRRPPHLAPQQLDPAALRYLAAIAESGSMSQAARLLSVTQPSVTTAIQNLESSLGVQLLHRERQGVTLTEQGRLLYLRALHVLDYLRETERLIQQTSTDETGLFTLGCHPSLGAYFLPRFLRELYASTEGIVIDLLNGSSSDTTQAVVSRQIQFGLVVNPLPHPDLVLVELFGDAVDLFARAEPDAPPDRTSLFDDLDEAYAFMARQRLIYASTVDQSHTLVQMLQAHNLDCGQRLVCGDFELVRSLTMAGIGVGIMPRRVAMNGGRGAILRVHPLLPCFPDTICLVYRADMPRGRAATRLKDALVQYGRSLGSAEAALDAPAMTIRG